MSLLQGTIGAVVERVHDTWPQQDAAFANEYEALAIENVRLVNENIMLENARLAQQNLLLRQAMQAPMPAPMGTPSMGWPHLNPFYPSGYPPVYAAAAPPLPYSSSYTLTKGPPGLERVPSSLASTSSETGSLSYGSSFDDAVDNDDAKNLPTSVMMRNIPNNYTRAMLLELINRHGFGLTYDFVYLPIDFAKKVGLGYAFINFIDHESAEQFRVCFSGFRGWTAVSEKVCQVMWSDVIQGRDAHIERYRNSPVMHVSVTDEFKPLLFKNGERLPFPPPTKAVSPPAKIQKSHK
jgi:hypothetical protein